MKLVLRCAWFVAFGGLFLFSTLVLTRRWTGWDPRELLRVRPEFRDAVVGLELELDLRVAPRLAGTARLALRPGTEGRLWFLLNGDLELEDARDGAGRELDWDDEGRLRSDYHQEARVLAVDLVGPSDELVLVYAGQGNDGLQGRDWMGVLMLAPDERRMSVQTAFYPQIPPDLDGPGARPWPTRMRVLLPEAFEAYAPGRPGEPSAAPGGGRAWSWETETPAVLSLFAAERVRRETVLGAARVVTLLTPEHAELGDGIASEVERMLRAYEGWWGPIGGQSLGVIEFRGRGASYNWTSEGIIAMEVGALSGSVPTAKLAHESAHLWWGQDTCPRGRGERFLTEGLAEYASWRFLEAEEGAAAAEAEAAAAEQRWWERVHETGVDPAPLDVRFRMPGYTELAYAKCPLTLWRLDRALGHERMDAVLRAYRERARGAPEGSDSAESFAAALAEHAPGVELGALERAGHAHLALGDVVFDGTRARGELRIEPCPARVAASPLAEVVLRGFGETGERRTRVAVDGARAAFELEGDGPIQAVLVDPGGPFRCPTPALAPGFGLVASEPAQGARDVELGPLVARLHFGTALAEPGPAYVRLAQRATLDLARERHTATPRLDGMTLEDGGRTLALALSETSPGGDHAVVLPAGLVSARGVPLPELTLAFSTRSGAGLPRPRVIASEPAAGARDVPADLARVKVVFSEPMRAGRGFKRGRVADLEDDGWTYPDLGEGRWEDERTLIWELERLEPGTRYGLPFAENYRSALGIESEPFDLCFETAR